MTTKRNLPAASKTLQITAVLAAFAAGSVTAQQPVPLKGVPRGELKVSAEAGPRPTGFGAGATSTSIRLVWTCPQGALGYEVYATPKGGVQVKLTQTPIGPQCLGNLSLSLPQDPRLPAPPQPTSGSYRSGYNHLGLAPAAEFLYVVRALYPSGFADSEPLTARTLWPAPTGFVASLVGRSASLQWNPIAGSPGYLVFRRMEGQSGFQPMTAAPLAATSYNDNTSLPPGQHRYYVQSVNGEPSVATTVLLGAWPAPASVTATATAPTITILALPPTTVRANIEIMNTMAIQPGTVSLSWAPVAGAAVYHVRWNGNGPQVATGPQASVSIAEPGPYTFSVTAFIPNGLRGVNYADETTPAKVTVQVGGVGPSGVQPQVYYGQRYLRLNWPVVPGAMNVQVLRQDPGALLWRRPTGGVIYNNANAGYEEREGAFDQVEFGRTYQYRVVMTGADGRPWFSPPVPVTIPNQDKWTGFVAQSQGSGSVDLSWNAPANVTGYEIWFAEQGYKPGRLVNLPATALSYHHQGGIFSNYTYEYTLFAYVAGADGPRQMATVRVK